MKALVEILNEHGNYDLDVLNVSNSGCVCSKNTCGCCEYVKMTKIHLDDFACINVTYVPNDMGINLTLSIDNHIYYSEEISVRNPPPICWGVPHLREYASLCIKIYDVDISKTNISACCEIEATLYHVRVERQKIGCFNIPI